MVRAHPKPVLTLTKALLIVVLLCNLCACLDGDYPALNQPKERIRTELFNACKQEAVEQSKLKRTDLQSPRPAGQRFLHKSLLAYNEFIKAETANACCQKVPTIQASRYVQRKIIADASSDSDGFLPSVS